MSRLSLATLRTYWDPKGFTQLAPSYHWSLQWWFVGFSAIVLVGAIVLVIPKVSSGLRDRLAGVLWTAVPLLVILYFLRTAQVPILGMDIFRALYEAYLVAYSAYAIASYLKDRPAEKLAQSIDAYKSKYLPKPKR